MNTRSTGGGTMRIALVGTRGVPARYGGFETCVEEVGQRLAAMGHDVVVYCRTAKSEQPGPTHYLGMELVHHSAPRRKSLETLVHSGRAVGHILTHRVDAAIVFNAANSPWLPVLKAARIPVATHVDGLEWQRARWGNLGRKYYRGAESLAVRLSDALIADAEGIQDYYTEEFNVETTLLAYGAPILQGGGSSRIAEFGLSAKAYHLVVARFLPENHVHMIVEGYTKSRAKLPLIVVGSHPYAQEYTATLHAMGDQRVTFVGGVWDQDLLDELYANALVYWHGHSVGGTNPSLLRAMGAGAATNAFDVRFNREVLGAAGQYFGSAADIPALAEGAEANVAGVHERGVASVARARHYDWDDIAQGYEAMCRRIVAGESTKALFKSRRRSPTVDPSFGDLKNIGAS
ncbi:DUF1972 domain-containing protein [Arthrobacter sp. TMN-49]